MPGFGSGPFGSGPFGSFDWSKQVLFRDLPEVDRRLDRTVGGGRLERYADALKPTFDELLRFTRRFGDLRDPDRVRTQFQGHIAVNVLDAAPSETGQTINARVEKLDDDPFTPLGPTSIGWILIDKVGREYTVNAVHKLRDSGPTVELVGTSELPTSVSNTGDSLTGTVVFTEGSMAVTGAGTAFTTEVSIGDYIAPQGGMVGRVADVPSDTSIVLESPYLGVSTSLVIGVVSQSARGAAVLRPPALISLLGADFGLEVDTHEPEAFQRSSVHDQDQWLTLKGAQRSYDIIAKIAGYRAIAFGLWRVDPNNAAIPPNELFEVPPGSGKFYTTLEPFRPFMDEVAADVVPLDMFCFETPDWTTDNITPPTPTPPDGTSVETAIGVRTQAMSIMSTADLGGGRWRIHVGPADMSSIGVVGYWYASFAPSPGARFFLETAPVEVAPGEWEFELLAGPEPDFGTTVNVDYQCHKGAACDYCRASVIRIEVTPVEIFSDPDALLDGVLQRLAAKLLQVIPAHVRVAEVVHVVGPVQAIVGISVQVSGAQTVTAAASVGYYFDIVPADALPVDPSHMSATAT